MTTESRGKEAQEAMKTVIRNKGARIIQEAIYDERHWWT